MEIRVKYIGYLNQVTGVKEETLELSCPNLEGLVQEVAAKYPVLTPHTSLLKCAMDKKLIPHHCWKSTPVSTRSQVSLLLFSIGG